jgi:hypothetical protein
LLLQNWENHEDVAQSILVYGTFGSFVCVICWLGNQLTEQVRINVTSHSQKYIYIYITPSNLNYVQFFQAESVRDAAWGCDWVGTPVPFQRCLAFIIATANKEFTLTAGKFVPVSNKTMMNVSNCHSAFTESSHDARRMDNEERSNALISS